MRSPAGWRLQKQSEPNDSAKLGACKMTLCSDLKGQCADLQPSKRKLKNAKQNQVKCALPLSLRSQKYMAQVVLQGCL